MTTQQLRLHMISWVAERYEIHPQTLRLYEREGLLQPARSAGNTRLYDDDTCEKLELILALTRDLGVNLAGVEVILNMKARIDTLEAEVKQLTVTLERETARRGTVPREHALVPRPAADLVRGDHE
jgi:MerR family transcriptional regulator, heat shock protein HspR